MKFIINLLVISVSLVSAHPSKKVFAASERERVEEVAVWNFGYMSSCATNSYSNRYNGYGCFCGFGGSGTPVDAVDTCCQVHDNCYDEIMAAKGGPCPDDTNLYIYTYSYSCTAPWSWFYPSEELEITCDSDENDECGQALCECDMVASLCFAANEFNEAYSDYDKEANCQA